MEIISQISQLEEISEKLTQAIDQIITLKDEVDAIHDMAEIIFGQTPH